MVTLQPLKLSFGVRIPGPVPDKYIMLINNGHSIVEAFGLEHNPNLVILDYGVDWATNWDHTTNQINQWLSNRYLRLIGNSNHKKRKIIVHMREPEAPPVTMVNAFLNKWPNALFIDGGAYSISPSHLAWPGCLNLPISIGPPIDWTSRDRHFVCLNRLPKYHRIHLVNHLFELNIINHGYVSLGGDQTLLSDDWKALVTEGHRHRMPLVLDRYFPSDRLIVSLQMQMAFVNVVCETDYETETKSVVYKFRTRLTEKTAKAFLMRQLPLFLAIPGHVRYVKEVGFDLFEDIIDHSYDSIADPDERIGAVAKELNRLCGIPMENLREYCKKNNQRFEDNVDRCSSIGIAEQKRIINSISEFINLPW